eukprot:5940987-Heterocapsa_arctica.AAC.1
MGHSTTLGGGGDAWPVELHIVTAAGERAKGALPVYIPFATEALRAGRPPPPRWPSSIGAVESSPFSQLV